MHNYFAKCAIDEEELIPVNQAEKSLGTCTERLSGCNPLQPKNKLEVGKKFSCARGAAAVPALVVGCWTTVEIAATWAWRNTLKYRYSNPTQSSGQY